MRATMTTGALATLQALRHRLAVQQGRGDLVALRPQPPAQLGAQRVAVERVVESEFVHGELHSR